MDRARLKQNLDNVQKRIHEAVKRAGRADSDVTLIGVTKSVDAETTKALIELGVHHIAENRVQMAEGKLPQVSNADRAIKHFIGPLQRNKVNKVLEWAACVHSVDSVKLARAINKRAPEAGRISLDIFVQVNIAGEDQKGGFAQGDVGDALGEMTALSHLNIRGLMCMAPYDDNPENARRHFKALAQLSQAMLDAGWLPPSGTALSMGMSGDFEIAVEEGATHIRVGSALFEGL